MTTMSTISGGSEHHSTAWYAEISSAERKTFWACVGGWVLDAMDVREAIIYVINPYTKGTVCSDSSLSLADLTNAAKGSLFRMAI